MKTMTYDEKITKVAKHLIKKFKEKEGADTIHISDSFTTYTHKDVIYDHSQKKDEGLNISFGDLSKEDVGRLTCAVARKVLELIKVSKKVRVFKDERKETHWGMWSHHDWYWVKKIVFITPCKEFEAINKKLVHLGCKEIPFEKWFGGSVFGKRSSYSMTSKTYYATDSKLCERVLEYLKGKKKVSYELYCEEHLENKAYGEEYETEWDGAIYYRLKFTDSKGETKVIR